MSFKFEDLRVWQKSLDLSDEINQLTKVFPKDEIFILTNQIKRAADSICLNVAEVSTGQSPKEFNRFLGIALRSGIEVVCCLHIAKRRGYIDEFTFKKYYSLMEELTISIQSLRKAILARNNSN